MAKKIKNEKIPPQNNGTLPAGIVATQEEIADAFDVSVRTVQHWVRDGMPVKPNSTYSIKDVQEWKYRREMERRQKTASSFFNTDEKIKQIKYKRELMDYKREQGDLIPRDDVEQELIQICIAIKRKFLNLRKLLVTQVYGQDKKEINIVLDREFKQVIQEFENAKIFDNITYADVKKVKKTSKMDQATLDLE